MRRRIVILFVLLAVCTIPTWTATNNSGNAPTFLWLDICTDGIGDAAPADNPIPRMSPDTVDVGVDLNADGTVDRWLSGEKTEYLGRENALIIAPGNFRRFLIRLDSDAGKRAKIRIVDKSVEFYIAVKAIRLNYADGVIVPNLVPNGFFEEDPALNHWTLLEGSITDKTQLLQSDPNGDYIFYGSKFYSTDINGVQDTAVIESDAFTLEPPSSFVYGMVSGGGSELWNIAGTQGSDNASYVYLDIGTATQDPNGRYDAGVDVPLTGFYGGSAAGVRSQMHPVFLNTSGQEGKRAQVVIVDDSFIYHVGADGWRMNWDTTLITNGGVEDIPEDWYGDESAREYNEHPSGGIPGWRVSTHTLPDGSQPDGSVFYYDKASHDSQFSNRAYVGTGGFTTTDRLSAGVELRSNVFAIAPIPDPRQSVFMQYAGGQGTNRIRAEGRGAVELQVDVNGNGTFDDPEDYHYQEISQGMGWNLNTSNLDLWQYPEYRFYIRPEHYGRQAVIYVEDTLTGGYGWMAVDDFYIWNGSAANLPFPNSDFEMGNYTNWHDEYLTGSLTDWLATSYAIAQTGTTTQNTIMNGRIGFPDGDYAADSAGGDGSQGTLTSEPFTIPTPVTTPVKEWSVY